MKALRLCTFCKRCKHKWSNSLARSLGIYPVPILGRIGSLAYTSTTRHTNTAFPTMTTPMLAQVYFEPSQIARTTKTVILGFITALIVGYSIRAWHEWRRLSHVPGPFVAAFTKLWLVFQSSKRRQPYAFKEANDRYGETEDLCRFDRTDVAGGSLVRVGPNEVITNDPEVLRKIMAVRSAYTRGHCKFPHCE